LKNANFSKTVAQTIHTQNINKIEEVNEDTSSVDENSSHDGN